MYINISFLVSVRFVYYACEHIQWDSRQPVGCHTECVHAPERLVAATLSWAQRSSYQPFRSVGIPLIQAQCVWHRSAPCFNISSMYVETGCRLLPHALRGSAAQRWLCWYVVHLRFLSAMLALLSTSYLRSTLTVVPFVAIVSLGCAPLIPQSHLRLPTCIYAVQSCVERVCGKHCKSCLCYNF